MSMPASRLLTPLPKMVRRIALLILSSLSLLSDSIVCIESIHSYLGDFALVVSSMNVQLRLLSLKVSLVFLAVLSDAGLHAASMLATKIMYNAHFFICRLLYCYLTDTSFLQLPQR